MTALQRTSAALACALLVLATPRAARAQGSTHDPGAADAPAVADASGTAWTPWLPVAGLHRQVGAWTTMVHGELAAQWLAESGSVHHSGRGASSVNWLMASFTRPVGPGRLTLRTMASAEPWTIPGCGYPDMLATGEVCEGDSIHDRQHPHDALMELTASVDWPLTASTRLQVYAGPVGEPALGPPAFLHRASALGNPVAPIAHHWLDSSHVTFGVLTTAVYGRRWKVDASVFNGREPDDRRRNIETGRWDAWSVRGTVVPCPEVVVQVSGGHLPESEARLGTLPRQDVSRVTASASRTHRLANGTLWAATLAWGIRWGQVNTGFATLGQVSHAVLVEGTLDRGAGGSWFMRGELVGKPAHDLHAEEFVPSIFTVGKVQLGYGHALATRGGFRLSAGASLSAGLLPPLLAPRYNGRVAPGAGIFLRVSPEDGSMADRHEHDHSAAHSP